MRSSLRPRSAREELWHTVGTAAGIPEANGITAESLTLIAAMLVKAGYRSTPQIVCQAVPTYRRQGGVWTEAMELAKGGRPQGSPPRLGDAEARSSMPDGAASQTNRGPRPVDAFRAGGSS